MNLSKSDNLWKSLDNVLRTQLNREKTLGEIKSRYNQKQRKKNIPVLITTVCTISIAILLSLSTIMVEPTKETEDQSYAEIFNNDYIVQSLISKSNTSTSFKPKENQPLELGVAMIRQDELWDQTLAEGIVKMKKTNDIPTNEPQYDLLIDLKESPTLKFKIWINDNNVVFKEVNKDQYYHIETAAAQGFGYILDVLSTLKNN